MSIVTNTGNYITNSAVPVVTTGYPLSVGAWIMIDTTGTEYFFGVADPATTNQYFRFGVNGVGNTVSASVAAGGTANSATTATGITTGAWAYVVGRYISSTNRRVTFYDSATGSIVHANSATSRAPTGFTKMGIGVLPISSISNEFKGKIAEFWWSQTDIQPDGGQLDNTMILQLAQRGPFSVPHIGGSLKEYHSFRKGLVSDSFEPDEVAAAGNLQTWVITGSPTVGPTVPYLQPNYARPRNQSRFVIV